MTSEARVILTRFERRRSWRKLAAARSRLAHLQALKRAGLHAVAAEYARCNPHAMEFLRDDIRRLELFLPELESAYASFKA